MREEIAQLRGELSRVQAATAASWEQCLALGASKTAAPVVSDVRSVGQTADESALAREVVELREALVLAANEARRLRSDERRLRGLAMRPPQRFGDMIAAGVMVPVMLLMMILMVAGGLFWTILR
ncbi:Hypothetical protein A7982_06687 [Minicystis rosea]|nr:Hypothetical protein A7982_06687 [Minicystis rosea]